MVRIGEKMGEVTIREGSMKTNGTKTTWQTTFQDRFLATVRKSRFQGRSSSEPVCTEMRSVSVGEAV